IAYTEMLAAAAPIAASIGGRPTADLPPWRIPKPETPLPILVMHGMDAGVTALSSYAKSKAGDTSGPVRISPPGFLPMIPCSISMQRR
ncbi:MAG: hypothetical protein KFF68_15290, partial [Desulfosarcina sp.]|nr:hypothetical protein [Desulfosarcina sp.]